MKLLKLIMALIVLSIACTNLAQGQVAQASCEPSKLQPDQSDVAISLEKIEEKESASTKPFRLVWFRLRNNTSCKVVLSTRNQHNYFARVLKDETGTPLKNASGGLRFEYSNDVLNDSVTFDLDVYVYSSNPHKRFRVGFEGGDSCVRFTQTLRSGESVLFQVPETLLRKGRTLSIEYGYEGEHWTENRKTVFNYRPALKEASNLLNQSKSKNESH